MNTWVDYIRDDIKVHITTGRPLPADLTLQGLSGHYAVSMTPIRRAVRELIADGYLCRRENGRLMVSARRFGRPSKHQAPTSGHLATIPARFTVAGRVESGRQGGLRS